MVNNATNRVGGTIQGISGIDWYHHPSTNTPNEFEPNASLIVTTTQLNLPYTIASLCPTSFAFNVEDAPPYSSINRNINYGYIVGDSGRFETENYFAFKYLTRGELYLTLKNNHELLSMSDEADDSFVEFYEDMRSSNYQKFDSAFMLIEKGEILNAENIVLSIDDTNDIEYNLKTALKIYLHSLLVDSVINSVDSSLLIEIANRNPLTGGNGVFIARNLLNLEIYDEEESGSRIGSYNQRNIAEKSIKVFPVPANDAVHIIPEGDFNPEGMELRSIKGELVYAGEFKSYFNIGFVKSGIYILKVYSGRSSLHSKIVKLP